jgi:response regulator RpfG family c-di-GMP phosphodiesterase
VNCLIICHRPPPVGEPGRGCSERPSYRAEVPHIRNQRASFQQKNRARILFIDDDHDTREMMRYTLADAGYEAIAADFISEGLRPALLEHVTFILREWRLADGEGVDLCRMIRNSDSQTPIY